MNTPKEAWDKYARAWPLEVVEPSPGLFEAKLSFRAMTAQGSTREEATVALMRLYCEMSRNGDFNPFNPDVPGVPPIQHVLSILEGMLARRIHERESNRRFAYECDTKQDDEHSTTNTRPGRLADGSPTWGSAYTKRHEFARDNEVISGLATAIAALARVKEL